jgi:ComEC/Rec2-related protein
MPAITPFTPASKGLGQGNTSTNPLYASDDDLASANRPVTRAATLGRWSGYETMAGALAMAWALGLWVAHQAPPQIVWWPWVCLLLGCAVLAPRLWVINGVVLWGVFWGALGYAQWRNTPLTLATGPVAVQGWVLNAHPLTVYVQHTQAFAPSPVGMQQGGYVCRVKGKLPVAPQVGQSVTLQGQMRLPFMASLPGTYHEQHHLHGLGITGVLMHPQATSKNKTGFAAESTPIWVSLWAKLGQIRQGIAQQLQQAFAGNTLAEGLMGGLLLGDDAFALPKAYHQALLKTGLLHTVSASGANLMMVAALLGLLTRWLPLPAWVKRTILGVGVTGYALLTGLPPSVQRAYAVLATGFGLHLAGVRWRPVTMVLVGVAAVLGLMPWLAQSVGFQLSVLATLGIVWLLPDGGQWPAGWRIWLGVPIAAELAVLPWSTSVFHQFSWVGIPMNWLMEWAIFPLTWLAFLGALGHGVGLPAAPLWQLGLPIINGINGVIMQVASWPGVWQTWPQWPAASLAAWYAGLWAVKGVPKPWRRQAVLGCLVMVVLGWLLWGMVYVRPHKVVTVLPDGQALAIYHAGGGHWCVVLPPEWKGWQQRALPAFYMGLGVPEQVPGCGAGLHQ